MRCVFSICNVLGVFVNLRANVIIARFYCGIIVL